MIELKRGLIPFITAGDPTLEISEQLALALIDEGACALEIGVPFSDPLADGPVIQNSSARALRQNINLDKIFAMVERISRRHPHIPLILFSYANPIYKMGFEKFAQRARASGAWGTLTVDLPFEEAKDYIECHRAYNLKTPFLVAPTTSQKRVEEIAKVCSGFVYLVSRTGVTGPQKLQTFVTPLLEENVRRIRSSTPLPIALGFGISNQAQAKQAAAIADLVVVGSAFVQLVESSTDPLQLEEAIRQLARHLTMGIPHR